MICFYQNKILKKNLFKKNFILYIVELTEIPPLILQFFRYSTDTRSSWMLSILIIFTLSIFISDLLYGFIYNRIHDTEKPSYKEYYWKPLLTIGISSVLLYIIFSYSLFRYKIRKFKKSTHGVGIVYFEIISINKDTLSSLDKMHTLNEIMHQIFLALKLLLDNDNYSKYFECRLLPSKLKIYNK